MNRTLQIVIVALALVYPSMAWAKTVVPFSGTIDLQSARVDLSFHHEDGQAVSAQVSRSAPGRYQMVLDLSHVKTPLCDVAAVIKGDFELTGTDPRKMNLAGEISSRYTLLDYKPVRDLYFKFMIKDRQLQIDSFWAGPFSGQGKIDLVGDKNMDLTLQVVSLDLGDIEGLLNTKINTRSLGLTGVATGSVNLRGTLSRPQILGRIALYNGHLKALEYESIILNFEGVYPLLRLEDVLVTHIEGISFRVRGTIDLASLGNLGEQVRLFERMPIVSKNGDRPEWVFKRLSLDGDAKTEMKYFLMKDDRGDASAVVGVQKSIGF